jgi:hypothetical protein
MTKANYLILLILIATLYFSLNAEPWKCTADANLFLSQSSYSNNWGGAGLSNLTWVASSNSTAEKQISAIMSDRTTLKLAFGQTHTQKVNANNQKYWQKPEKSTDQIDLESVLKFNFQIYVDPFISGRYESQFLDMSDPDNTKNFNPNRFTESAGLARTFIKQDDQNLNARIGAAFRQSIDREKLDPDSGNRSTYQTNDGGIEFIADYNKVIKSKDISYASKLRVYQALFNSKSKDLPNNNWKAPDMTWEHSINTKLWSIVSLNFYFELLYEKEQAKALQYKETLGLGVSYQLF